MTTATTKGKTMTFVTDKTYDLLTEIGRCRNAAARDRVYQLTHKLIADGYTRDVALAIAKDKWIGDLPR